VNRQNQITELEQARLRRLPLLPSLQGAVPGTTSAPEGTGNNQ
jgi:hypothetical protein